MTSVYRLSLFFFFNDTATTEIYTLSLHDALPIFSDPWNAWYVSFRYGDVDAVGRSDGKSGAAFVRAVRDASASSTTTTSTSNTTTRPSTTSTTTTSTTTTTATATSTTTSTSTTSTTAPGSGTCPSPIVIPAGGGTFGGTTSGGSTQAGTCGATGS